VDVVEQALREVLTDERLDLPVAPGAVDAVHRGVRRRRRRRAALVSASALAGVAAVVVAVLAVQPGAKPRSHDELAAPSSWRLGAPVDLPASAGQVTSMSGFGNDLWLGTSTGRLVHVDELRRTFSMRAAGGRPLAVAYTPRHVWVALAGCRLRQLSAPDARPQHNYDLGCAGGASVALDVEANGDDAWVSVADPAHDVTRLVRINGRTHLTVAHTTVHGVASGEHPMTLGGSTVLVATSSGGAETLTAVDALKLTTVRAAAIPVPGDVSLAYDDRVFVSVGRDGTGGVFAFDVPSLARKGVSDRPAVDVTTGDGLAWLLTGDSPAHLLGMGALTQHQYADVTLPAGTARHAISDGATVWVAIDRAGRTRLYPVSFS
jgi:hypothetical protein